MRVYQRTDRPHPFPYPNAFALLRDRAVATPDRDFVIGLARGEERCLTYQAFLQETLRVRALLEAKGLGRGMAINLIIQNSVDFLAIYFAALSLGVVVAPINYNFTAKEMSYIIRDSQGRLLFIEDEHLPKLEAMRAEGLIGPCEAIVLADGPGPQGLPTYRDSLDPHAGAAQADPSGFPDLAGLDDPAVIIYTSGTSGNPKGAILTHGNLLADAQAIAEWFRFDAGTRTLCILPLFHNNGQVVTLLAPLWGGGSTILVKGNVNLRTFWHLADRFGATWSSVIPTILSVLLAFKIKRTDRTMVGIVCGGALLPTRVQEDFEATFGVPIYEGFGLTETTSFSCFNPLALGDRVPGSIGKPLPVNDMAILDEDGSELPDGTVGEICIRGYNVFLEYCGLPERNATVFRHGWFHSGDLGFRDAAGFYHFQGRNDDLIIKGGENIYPREVENVLYGHPKIQDCAVIGVAHALWGETLAVFVQTLPGQPMTKAEVVACLQGQVADYKIPSEIHFLSELEGLDEIPKGPTNKILRKELRRYHAERLAPKP
jgi:acyl-CoA synthetase (AMP-forming)/AMP-acid ligase II